METPERIEPCDASRAYLDAHFDQIECRIADGEIDIREAELLRAEHYEWAVEHIGVPRFEEE